MKICKVCLEEKDQIQFYKDKHRPDGYARECKECCNKRKKKFREENREHVNKIQRENSKKHVEKKAARESKRYWENRDKILEKNRNNYSKNKEKIRKRQNELQKTPEKRLKNRERQKKWQKENSDKFKKFLRKWISEHRDIARAHYAISDATRRGKMMRPSNCSLCLVECKPDGHHEDYSKPLEVQWLCKVCHNKKHGKLLDV